ncbi:MAG: hypothetical protein AAFY17_00425 [Cyanobacteria bacterium J06642_11]
MALIDVIEVKSGEYIRRIELHHGDLTNLPPQDAVDLLILSAFQGECLPTPHSLIGSLDAKGLSVYDLSQDKAIDLRQIFSCWLSHPIQSDNPDLRFDRILCFEPPEHSYAPNRVGDIFRALAPFMESEPNIRTAAMPILATGAQGYSINAMLPPIIKTAIHWMTIGMPLETLKIFTYTDAEAKEAKRAFAKLKLQTQYKSIALAK